MRHDGMSWLMCCILQSLWCLALSGARRCSHLGALKKKKNLLSKSDVKSMQKFKATSSDLSYNFAPFYPLGKTCLERANSFKTSGTFMVCGSCLSFHRSQPCGQIVTAGMMLSVRLGLLQFVSWALLSVG